MKHRDPSKIIISLRRLNALPKKSLRRAYISELIALVLLVAILFLDTIILSYL